MATTDVNSFLLSLAAAIAAAKSIELAATPRALWIHAAVEAQAADVYTVLRIYRGSEPGHFAGMRTPNVSVQADTRGGDGAAVLAQAWAVHEALLDDEGRPRMHWSIDGKRFAAADESIEADPAGGWFAWVRAFAQAPGLVGRDESQRWIATGNFDIEFERQPAAEG